MNRFINTNENLEEVIRQVVKSSFPMAHADSGVINDLLGNKAMPGIGEDMSELGGARDRFVWINRWGGSRVVGA